jgi:hypothetical protein
MAQKFISLLKAREPCDRLEFTSWFLSEYAPQFLRIASGLRRWSVRLPANPPQMHNAPPLAHSRFAMAPSYDLVMEMWFDSVAEFRNRHRNCRSGSLASQWADRVGCEQTYRVTPHAAKDLSGPSAITYIALLVWKTLPREEAWRHWQAHEQLALRVHIGAARYERNWVDESLTADPERVGGITDFAFGRLEDLEQRFWSSADGTREVVADVAKFCADAHRIYLTDWNILRP